MNVAVVIPTLNEEQSIGGVVSGIPRHLVNRIIVADGGSRDGTAVRASAAGAEVIDAGRGYGRACLAGVLAAEGADVIVFMDGDGADDPAAIDDLMAENHEHCYSAFSLLFLVAKAGVVEPLSSVIEKHPSLDLTLAVIRLLASSGEPEGNSVCLMRTSTICTP